MLERQQGKKTGNKIKSKNIANNFQASFSFPFYDNAAETRDHWTGHIHEIC
jgi:hypothetical protein